MKRLSENKKVKSAVMIILLVAIVVIVGIFVKNCSKRCDGHSTDDRTEHGIDNPGLEVEEPENGEIENEIEAPASWEEQSESNILKSNEEKKNDSKKDVSNSAIENESQNTNEQGSSSEEILQDDKKWGDIF